MKKEIKQVWVINDEHALLLSLEEIEEFNQAASWVDRCLSGKEIYDFFAIHHHIYYRGKMWGFNDTEVREEICAELEKQK